MIEVKLFSETDGMMSGFEVTGHSGTAAHGQDIVCAGVSSLSQTALLGLGEYLKREVEFKAESGELYVKLKGEPDELTEAILRTMVLGLREIEKIAPNAVKVKESKR